MKDSSAKLFGIFVGYCIVSSLLGWWAQWVFETLSNQDTAFWKAWLFMGGILFVLPDKIKWIATLILFLVSGYIWFLM